MAFAAFPAIPAQATDGTEPIKFIGAGWGHGVGMSQWGAYSRALQGQTYVEILTGSDGVGYYQGATIGTLGVEVVDPGPIFTNVASDTVATTLTVLDGPGTPHEGIIVTRVTGLEPQPTATLFTRGGGIPNDSIAIVDTTPQEGAPGGCQATLTIDGAVTTWASGTCDFTFGLTSGDTQPAQLIQATNCRTANCTFGYGTALHLVDNQSTLKRTRSDCITGNCTLGPVYQGFDIVVESSLDEYTRGIAEVPFWWPVEALKTQAVAARSYAASFVVSTDHTAAGCFCAVKNSSAFQVYAGWVGGSALSNLWDSAALSTNGQVLVHPVAPDAQIVRAYYSSSNGGASEWIAEKWNADLPYLVSVPDPYSLDPANWAASWTFEYTASAVVDVVWDTSVDYTLTGAQVVETNVSGSAKTVRFSAVTPGGASLSVDLSSATVTSAFGLHSWYFQIDDSAVQPPPPKGPTAVGVQDQRTGIWTLRFEDGSTSQFYFGDPSDIPFIGDWNGDGIETVGLYRESTGFLFLRYTNDQGIGDVRIYYGNPDDLPVAGDWNGDGVDTVGIYRPSEARFYLRNTNTQGIADVDVAFGQKGDVPIAGDWDGDGIDTVGVYRPSTRMLYLTNSIPGGQVDFTYFYEGAAPGDRIIAGDWNFDGVDTIGVFRPSTSTFYLRDTFTQESANLVFSLGRSWMNPIAGFWGK